MYIIPNIIHIISRVYLLIIKGRNIAPNFPENSEINTNGSKSRSNFPYQTYLFLCILFLRAMSLSLKNPAECCESRVDTGLHCNREQVERMCSRVHLQRQWTIFCRGVWCLQQANGSALGRECCSKCPKRMFRTIACCFHGNRL